MSISENANEDTVAGSVADDVAPLVTENGQDAPTQGEDTVSAADDKGAAAKKGEWYIDTITGLRAGKREVEAKAADLAAQNAALMEALAAAKRGDVPVEPETPVAPLSENEIERRAREYASQIAASENFTKKCNDVYDAGKGEYADFDDSLAKLVAVGATGQSANPAFLQAVTELPNSHKLLHHLGNNPEEAARITKLPPMKMAIELAKIENSLSNPKARPVSAAPAPITPVNGKGKSDIDLSDPALEMKEWVEKRRAEKAKRQAV